MEVVLLDISTTTLAQLLAVLDAVDEGIHIVDEQGITRFYNNVAARLDGLRKEDVINKPVLPLFPSLTRETSTLLCVLETGTEILNKEQTFTNFKGDRITTVNSTLPIWDSGRLVGALEVSKDISYVRELTEKVNDLRAQIYGSRGKQTAKQDAKGSEATYTFEDIIGKNKRLLEVINAARKAALSRSSVLVYGETGTGKELLVQAIHNSSPRRRAPFIAQDCGALPESLLEGILFGTRRGSFTGSSDRPGLFELADGGTLFLDELGNMDRNLQVKLLRVIQSGRLRRVGDTNTREVDVRLIAAMSQPPLEAVRAGALRPELFYRLNVIYLHIPPLRERREDIMLLVDHFIKYYNELLGTNVVQISSEVRQMFLEYSWPGNVRELQHAIEGAVNITDGPEIGLQDLPAHLRSRFKQLGREQVGLRKMVQDFERERIIEALNAADGNISRAAAILSVPRQTLQYKIKSLEI